MLDLCYSDYLAIIIFVSKSSTLGIRSKTMATKANKVNFTGISQNTHYITVGYGESIASYQWFDPIHRTLPAIINEVLAKFPNSMITDMVHNDSNLVITFENDKYTIEIFVESAE